jgi:8-oxo-dGTP diphosphatase
MPVIAIAVVEHQGRFLVGKRPEGVPLAGCWEFPGGKVQSGETPAAAAVRECLEETGLTVAVQGTYPSVVYDYPHGQVDLRFFACSALDASDAPREPFVWLPRADLAGLEFPPANAALLAQLLNGAP